MCAGALFGLFAMWGARRLSSKSLKTTTSSSGQRLYIPRKFRQPDLQPARALVRKFPLATVVVSTAHGLDALHVPLVLAPDLQDPERFGMLRGHVARANPLWRSLEQQPEAVAIFQAAQGYVSPGFYPSKKETHTVVPTWNYVTVHAHGRLRAVDNKEWVRAQVEALTDQQEAGRAEPWRVSDAPEGYLDRMQAAIIGIELRVSLVHAKTKASQDKSKKDREGVVRGLMECATPENQAEHMASWVVAGSAEEHL
eukprot:TRINITY_DN54503_c0_g1_i1.p1 TRINITY_DN54503_c0_g1~~TRINITY_DN54503_c0_g1_i1.p1  ORF type:complete len:254 (+),score=41.69 TRINITY_DN54503_c0_g1_i1:2-763(+)